MPKTQKKKQAFEADHKRHVIARLYLQGQPQHAIGEKMKISQQAVCNHLKKVRSEWKQSALVDFNERKSIEVAKIDEVERCAYEGWVRSLAVVAGKPTKDGNPRFLDVITKCIQQRKEIFGLNAPLEIVGGGSLPWLEDEPTDIEATVTEPGKRIEE